jgi:hypothetical protein
MYVFDEKLNMIIISCILYIVRMVTHMMHTLSFFFILTMAEVDNLGSYIYKYFEIFYIMIYVGSLDVYLGCYFRLFSIPWRCVIYMQFEV